MQQENNINLLTYQFNSELLFLFTQYSEKLPISNAYYVIKDLYQSIQKEYLKYIQFIQNQPQEAKEEEVEETLDISQD